MSISHRSCFLLSLILLSSVMSIAQTTSIRSENAAASTVQSTTPPSNNSSRGIQNPSNPTGPNMRTDIDYPAKVETLTPEIVNNISKSLGIDTSGNNQLVNPTELTTPSTTSTTGSKTAGTTEKSTTNQQVIPAAGPITPKSVVDAATQTPEPTRNSQSANNTVVYSLFDNAGTIKDPQSRVEINIPATLSYTAQNVDTLQNYNKSYQLALTALAKRQDFSGRVIFVESADLKDVGTVYRIIYHVNGSTYARGRILVRLGQQVRIQSKWQAITMATIRITALRLKTQLDQIDLILRRLYKDSINGTTLENSQAHDFAAEGVRVYFLNYTDRNARSQVIVKEHIGLYSVLSFKRSANVQALYTILPSVAWRKMQQYDTVNRLATEYATRKQPKNVSLLSVSAFGQVEGDRVRFCNSYMVANNFANACSSINIVSRNASLDYFRLGIIATEPSSDQYYEQEYSEMIGDPVFSVIDAAAKKQFGDLIKDAPISKVELKVTSTGRSYRLTYQTSKYNVLIGYNQPI